MAKRALLFGMASLLALALLEASAATLSPSGINYEGSIQLDMASEVPIVTESAGSSPPPKVAKKPEQKSSEQAPVGSKFQLCTETPALPPFIGPAFDQAATNDLSAGNHSYIRELKEHGHLGLFLKRSAATTEPEFFELRPSDFFEAIQGTLQTVLLRLLKLKSKLSDTEIVDRADSMSIVLATGCCVTAFLKLRAIILNYPERYSSAILKGPRISSALPVPTAYAVAIQQFGEVNIADMPTSKKAIPCFPQTGHTYGIPNPHRWSSNAYSQAVEYARSLGMRFSIVDLKVKNGSAWWLLRQHFAEDVFELQCSVPEVNFTEEMAVTHTLFLKDDEINPSNPFINITSLGADNYGTFLSNPHQGINVSSFEAFSDAAAEVWQNV